MSRVPSVEVAKFLGMPFITHRGDMSRKDPLYRYDNGQLQVFWRKYSGALLVPHGQWATLNAQDGAHELVPKEIAEGLAKWCKPEINPD